jgi:hypothetical protein
LTQTNLLAGLNLLVEMGAFEKMPKEGSISSKDLAALVGIDESAIGEVMFQIELSRH